MLKFLMAILNVSPFFHISSDEKYGGVCEGVSKARFSLAYIGLGYIKIYILSAKSKKCSLFKVLKLSNFTNYPQIACVEARAEEYYRECNVSPKTKPDILRNHIEFLSRKLEYVMDSKSQAHNKINFYLAIYIFISGYAIYYMTNVDYSFISEVVVLGFLVLNLADYAVYLYEFNRNKAVVRSSFQDLKKRNSSLEALAYGIYLDWYAIKEEVQHSFSIVKNVENSFISAMSLIVVSYLLSVSDFSAELPRAPVGNRINSLLMTAPVSQLERNTLAEFLEISEVAINGRIQKIYVIRNFEDQELTLYAELNDYISEFGLENIVEDIEVDRTNNEDYYVILKPIYY